MASPPLVVPALKKHTATVIMAHGLGDSGAGWMSLAQNWRRRDKFSEVSFIFPNAPTIPITVNSGMQMPGWYNFEILGGGVKLEEFLRRQDEPGILRSRNYFNSIIKEEVDKGVKPSRIVLGGFSQGGAMALFTGITNTQKIGGIFGLSCYLPLSDQVKVLIPEDCPNKQTPIFMGHGTADMILQCDFGKKSADYLKELGHDVEFRTYPELGHSADIEEIEDLENFLQKVIPPEGGGGGL
ncbi:Phospholipase/carboxylesterase/thioesterase [Elaphomyces granulatus]|jgi:predicted esterase